MLKPKPLDSMLYLANKLNTRYFTNSSDVMLFQQMNRIVPRSLVHLLCACVAAHDNGRVAVMLGITYQLENMELRFDR